MNLKVDLEQIGQQEQMLQFERFGSDEAWSVGSRLRGMAMERGAGMTFEVQIAGRVLFSCATDGASAGQADWIRRKRNTVMRFGKSSYAVGLGLESDGTTLEARQGLPLADFAAHGGGFPIALRGTGLVGTVVASGLAQRDDHAMVVQALAGLLGIHVPQLEA